MKRAQLTSLLSQQVTRDSSTAVTVLLSDWMLQCGTGVVDAAMELRAISGAYSGAMRVRYAKASTQRPGAWGTATTARTTEAVWPERFDVSATQDQMWVQVGAVGLATTGVAESLVRLQAAAQGIGSVLAEQTIEIEPDTNSGSYSVVPLGKPFAQANLDKVMYGIVFSGVSGTITYRPVYREIKGNPDFPEAWTDLGSGDDTATANSDVNTGLLTVAPTGGRLLGQVGMKYTGTGRGTMKIVVAGVF